MMTLNVSLKCMAVKKFNFKIPRWRTAGVLKIEKLQCLVMVDNGSQKRIDSPPS